MKVLIAGGSGYIGGNLAPALSSLGHSVTVFTRYHAQTRFPEMMKIEMTNVLDPREDYDVVIHLAGAPLDSKRWNDRFKTHLIESRVQVTRSLNTFLAKNGSKPKLYIVASAVGYYGSSETEVFTESSKPVDESFSARMCAQIEREALEAVSLHVKVVILRLGVVLDKGKGILGKMHLPFSWGLGARLGEGNQWMSWIHIVDVVESIIHILKTNTNFSEESELSVVYNLTSPNPVKHKEFVAFLGRAFRRPVLFELPRRLVGWIFGEMGQEILLKGQRVLPERLLKEGYTFRYPKADVCLEDTIRKP
jgi:uncharacterized protein (TIGR01777 family)